MKYVICILVETPVTRISLRLPVRKSSGPYQSVTSQESPIVGVSDESNYLRCGKVQMFHNQETFEPILAVIRLTLLQYSSTYPDKKIVHPYGH